MINEFRFVTEWRIKAPLSEVYDAVTHCLDWPTWWEGVEKVEKLDPGDADGVRSMYRFTWRGRIPYRFTFDFCLKHVQPLAVIEGQASGEVIGVGRWTFSHENGTTKVRYEWWVRTNRLWMNLIAPIAWPIFRWNHHQVMRQGAEGLARLLKARLESVHTSQSSV